MINPIAQQVPPAPSQAPQQPAMDFTGVPQQPVDNTAAQQPPQPQPVPQPVPQSPTLPPQTDFSGMMPEQRPLDLGINAVNKAAKAAEKDQIQAGKAYNQANLLEQQAVTEQTKAKIKQAEQEAPWLEKQAKLAEEHQIASNMAREQAQARSNEQLGLIKQYQDQLTNDPKLNQDFWADKSIGQKVLWGIGLALGGFAEGASNGAIRSGAMQIFQQALADDSQMKQRRYQLLKGKIDTAKDTLAMYRQQGLDEQAALQANMLNGYAAIEARVKAIAGNNAAPQVQAQAQQLIAQLQQKQALSSAELANRIDQTNMAAAQNNAHLHGIKEQLDTTMIQKQWAIEQQKAAAAAGTEYKPSVIGFAPSQNDKDYHDLVSKTTAYSAGHSAAEDLKSAINQNGRVSRLDQLDYNTQSKIRQQLAYLTLQIKTAYGLGAISEKDAQLTQDVIGGGAAAAVISPKTVLELYDRFNNMMKRDALDFAKRTGQFPLVKDPLDIESLDKSTLDQLHKLQPRTRKASGKGQSSDE